MKGNNTIKKPRSFNAEDNDAQIQRINLVTANRLSTYVANPHSCVFLFSIRQPNNLLTRRSKILHLCLGFFFFFGFTVWFRCKKKIRIAIWTSLRTCPYCAWLLSLISQALYTGGLHINFEIDLQVEWTCSFCILSFASASLVQKNKKTGLHRTFHKSKDVVRYFVRNQRTENKSGPSTLCSPSRKGKLSLVFTRYSMGEDFLILASVGRKKLKHHCR